MVDQILPRKRWPMSERFWKHVDKNGPIHPVLGTRCWLWTASTSNGYGMIGRPGQFGGTMLAHRYSYEQHVGPIPDGMNVLHHCDVRPCVNYEGHLFLGTRGDNAADCIAKGRTSYRFDGSVNRNKTHCPKGHPYSTENTQIVNHRTGDIERRCRICRSAYRRALYARQGRA